MQKLMIADSSEPFSSALADALGSDFEIQICADGETALDLLLSFCPDVLIINLQLPFKDGLPVLQEAACLPPPILVTTSHLTPYVERCTAALGVAYTMITPAVSALRVRVMDICNQAHSPTGPNDLSVSVCTHLHIQKFMTHLDGYQQLCAAIPRFHADPHQRLTKELYPAVAQECGCKDSRSVEHSIRKAILAAWKARTHTVWAKYFPPNDNGEQPCPTNKEFISRIAQMLHT